MTAADSFALITQLIDEGRRLVYGSGDYDLFRQRGAMILRRVFGDKNQYVASWNAIAVRAAYSYDPARTRELHQDAWESARKQCVNLLSAAAEELTTFGPTSTPAAASNREVASRKVFVVHGHDEGLKQTLARLLEKLDLKAIILHEQPNKGRTLIEKFEDYADVSFAVVLLTPDDMGYSVASDPSAARPRARQNVVLELGFFLGQLGREHVTPLFAGAEDFEKPSDYDGVTYIPIDPAGAWQYHLARELRAAGIEVDTNKIIEG